MDPLVPGVGGRRGVRDDERIGNNEIVVYYRADNGTLAHIQTIATGGASGPQLTSGDSLGSQGGLVLDERHRLLFAVNTDTLAADSQEGSIILFHVARDGTLKLADRVASGELYPDSLTVKTAKIPPGKELLYVLNAGGPNRLTADGSAVGPSPAGAGPNITGFAVNPAGRMKFLPGSVQMTNPGPTGGGSGVNCPASNFPAPKFDCGLNPPAFPRSPGPVGFTPDGDQLVVTVKGTNSIYVFSVGENGKLGKPTVTQAPGPALPTYFGFAFDQREHLILSEPFGSATTIPAGGTGAVSTFAIAAAGSLQQISASVGDGGTAACWIALDRITGRFAYVSNNGSANVSKYMVGTDGSVTLLDQAAATGNEPNDLAAVAEDDRASFLYVLFSGGVMVPGLVGAYKIDPQTGSLTSLGTIGLLPTGGTAQGLAAF